MNAAALIWIVIGIVLILAELLTPALICMFFGAAAIVVGGIVAVGWLPGFATQLGAFAAISLLLLLSLRSVAKRLFKGLTSDIAQTEPGFEDFVGREATVVGAFNPETRKGRVAYRGTDWTAECPHPLSTGEPVRITARVGSTLIVEKISR